ncbi:MAG TPA: flagellar protein FliT [Bacilli bacterium]|nr:flagellar protein FliT [Bacilli bacterium]
MDSKRQDATGAAEAFLTAYAALTEQVLQTVRDPSAEAEDRLVRLLEQRQHLIEGWDDKHSTYSGELTARVQAILLMESEARELLEQRSDQMQDKMRDVRKLKQGKNAYMNSFQYGSAFIDRRK